MDNPENLKPVIYEIFPGHVNLGRRRLSDYLRSIENAITSYEKSNSVLEKKVI
jgi:hypothetical protein